MQLDGLLNFGTPHMGAGGIMRNGETEDRHGVRDTDVADAVPLVVDLDGTLIHGDSLWESFFALAKVNFFGFLAAAGAVRNGRAALKAAVAKRFTPKFEDFCFNPAVVDFARREASERPVILATAANERLANIVADGLGYVSVVIASGKENRKSGAKLDAIQACLAERGWGEAFDYIGDHPADRPIWAVARGVYVVAKSDDEARLLAAGPAVTRRFDRNAVGVSDVVTAMRPSTWPWALPPFVPFMLSGAGKIEAGKGVAIASFCLLLVSIAGFLINDVLDIYSDRQSANKRSRLFASGTLNIPLGVCAAIGVAMIAIAVAGLALPYAAAAIIVLYPVCAFAYTLTPARWRNGLSRLASALYAGGAVALGALVIDVPVGSENTVAAILGFSGLAAFLRFVRMRS